MLAFLRSLFHRRTYPPGHPIVESRELVTEGRLRQAQGERIVERAKRTERTWLESALVPPRTDAADADRQEWGR